LKIEVLCGAESFPAIYFSNAPPAAFLSPRPEKTVSLVSSRHQSPGAGLARIHQLHPAIRRFEQD
jgi:hypothetical protein